MYVKKVIVQTFLEIGNKEGFDKITINKIVKDCNISRTTFYYYFKDLPDVIDYFLKEKIQNVYDNCIRLKTAQERTQYWAENLIYNFPEYKKLLGSKWRIQTEIYLHKYWKDFVEKMFSLKRKGILTKEEERNFLIEFICGAVCDFIVYGNHEIIDAQSYAEQFCLLFSADWALSDKNN